MLLADEPTGSLDPDHVERLIGLLEHLNREQGMTIVMVTHEPTVAAYAQEVAVLKDGRLIERFATDGMQDGQTLAARYQECVR